MNSRISNSRFASITFALLVGIGLSACGGGDGGDGSSAAATSPATNTSTGAAAAAPAPTPETPAPTPVTTPAPSAMPSTQAATLSWSAPTAKTDGSSLHDLAGYVIVYGTSEGDLNQSVRIENPSIDQYIVEQLPSGTYYFGVKAYDAAGAESELSNLMTKVIS